VPTRVLVLSAHDGWLDRRIISETNALAASGRDVTLLSVPAEIPPGCLDERVRLLVPARPHPVAWQHRFGKTVLRKLSGRLYDAARSWQYRRGNGPAGPLTEFFLQHTPQVAFDAIHCHDLPTLPAAVALAARRPGTRVVYDSHEWFPFQFTDRNVERYWLEIECTHIKQADAVITVNESIADELAGCHGIDTPAVVYNSYGIGNGVAPVDEETFARHFGVNDRKFTVLYQGNFAADRNIETLIAAFRQLNGSARLFLLGDGPHRHALQQCCRAAGMKNVHFGGWISQAELLRYTARADLGVIPYLGGTCRNTLYCTPNKLFEFIEARVPICASDLPELRKIITQHGNGGVYPMDSATRIAEAIHDAQTCAERGAFSATCLDTARDAYSWSKQVESLLGVYDRLGV
jgi:glycosyltransferase involved in cell wall biosynthesis